MAIHAASSPRLGFLFAGEEPVDLEKHGLEALFVAPALPDECDPERRLHDGADLRRRLVTSVALRHRDDLTEDVARLRSLGVDATIDMT